MLVARIGNYKQIEILENWCYTLVYDCIHDHVYLGENSCYIGEAHKCVNLGLGTPLCGMGHMTVYPTPTYMPMCSRCILCRLSNIPLCMIDAPLCTFKKNYNESVWRW